MGHWLVAQTGNRGSFSLRQPRGNDLASGVQGKNVCFLQRRTKKSSCQMTIVMVHHLQLYPCSLGKNLDISPDHLEILKIAEQVMGAVTEMREKGLNSPIIQQTAVHIVVKGEIVYLLHTDSRLPQAEADGAMGELSESVLLADQSLFFNKSDQFAIAV